MNDTRLRVLLAEMLYAHDQVADDGPMWVALPVQIREHWQDQADAALAMVRLWDAMTPS